MFVDFVVNFFQDNSFGSWGHEPRRGTRTKTGDTNQDDTNSWRNLPTKKIISAQPPLLFSLRQNLRGETKPRRSILYKTEYK